MGIKEVKEMRIMRPKEEKRIKGEKKEGKREREWLEERSEARLRKSWWGKRGENDEDNQRRQGCCEKATKRKSREGKATTRKQWEKGEKKNYILFWP